MSASPDPSPRSPSLPLRVPPGLRLLAPLLLAGLLAAPVGGEPPPADHDPAHHGGHDGQDGQGDDHRMHHDGPAETHDGGMRHDFSDAARWAEMFDDPERDAWQRPDRVVEVMGVAPGHTVADLGAGTGYFLPWLHRAVGPEGRVLALDPEPDMVEWMRARAEREGLDRVEVRRIPTDDPGLEAAEADRILVVDTWHHIGARVEYVGHLCRALRPGGSVWVVDFTAESPHGPPARHRLSAEEVAGELRAGGLEPEVVGEDLPHQWIVAGRKSAGCPDP